MQLEKLGSQVGGLRSVKYDDHLQQLTVLLKSGDRMVFSAVPLDLVYGIPAGQNALAYLKRKIYGRFEVKCDRWDVADDTTPDDHAYPAGKPEPD